MKKSSETWCLAPALDPIPSSCDFEKSDFKGPQSPCSAEPSGYDPRLFASHHRKPPLLQVQEYLLSISLIYFMVSCFTSDRSGVAQSFSNSKMKEVRSGPNANNTTVQLDHLLHLWSICRHHVWQWLQAIPIAVLFCMATPTDTGSANRSVLGS